VVPGFHCSFLPGMPSSPTPGESDIDMFQNFDADIAFAAHDHRLGTPNSPAIPVSRPCRSAQPMSLMGHFQPKILRAATRLAAGLASKLTQIQPLGVSQFRPGSAASRHMQCSKKTTRSPRRRSQATLGEHLSQANVQFAG
jgi:hypothetical protein